MIFDPAAVRLEGTLARGRFVHDFPDGSQAEMRFFEIRSGVVAITHTETPPQHRGQGVAGALVAKAVERLAAGGRKIVPLCPFVAGEFRSHPEWARLLGER